MCLVYQIYNFFLTPKRRLKLPTPVTSCTYVACIFIYCHEIGVVKWKFKFRISQCTWPGITMYQYVAACRLMCPERGMNYCNKHHGQQRRASSEREQIFDSQYFHCRRSNCSVLHVWRHFTFLTLKIPGNLFKEAPIKF